MRIYLGLKIVLAVALVAGVAAGTAEDDEVDTSVPNYPHKFYSGIPHPMQGSSIWASSGKISSTSTMSSSPPRATSPMTPSSSGSVVHPDAPDSSPASMRMAPSSSSQEKSPSISTKMHGTRRPICSIWTSLPVLDFLRGPIRLSLMKALLLTPQQE